MNSKSCDKTKKFVQLDIEKLRSRGRGDEIYVRITPTAVDDRRVCPFSNELNPFKFDNDLPLPFCCHKIMHLRVKIAVSRNVFLTNLSLPQRA